MPCAEYIERSVENIRRLERIDWWNICIRRLGSGASRGADISKREDWDWETPRYGHWPTHGRRDTSRAASIVDLGCENHIGSSALQKRFRDGTACSGGAPLLQSEKKTLKTISTIRGEIIRFKVDVHRSLVGIQIPSVELNPDATSCPQCQSGMKVRNVRPRRLVTMRHGVVFSRITTLICENGCGTPDGKREISRPEELEGLVPPGANIGYDVEVFCGMRRHLNGFQREEIKKQLESEHGVFISSRTVSVLANRFVEHFGMLHKSRAPAFVHVLKGDGGTPWEVDATAEEGSGTVLIVYAGWRGWVLGAWKIATESVEQIKPQLHETAARFGDPLAVVRDFGKGMTPAVEEFARKREAKIDVLGCRTHFVKFVGGSLLAPEYSELRQLVRRHNTRANLRRLARAWSKKIGEELSELKTKIEIWMSPDRARPLPKGSMGIATVRAMAQSTLDSLENNKNQRFPFVMPYVEFHQCCEVLHQACVFYSDNPETDRSVHKVLKQLIRVLSPMISDPSFEPICQKLSFRFKLFSELRTALRLNSDDAAKKVKPEVQEKWNTAKELDDIEKSLRKYTSALKRQYPRGETDKEDQRQAIDTILKHLDEHREYLRGHVIRMPKSLGGGVKTVCRTNNCLENFNGRLKQVERKRSGRKVLSKDFEDLPDGAPLI